MIMTNPLCLGISERLAKKRCDYSTINPTFCTPFVWHSVAFIFRKRVTKIVIALKRINVQLTLHSDS